MEIPKPTREHEWLLQLTGDWKFESECSMGPGQPAMKSIGKQTTRSLGSLWTLGEMVGTAPNGQEMPSVFTLGFDPQKQRFVGTFITSCMTHLWPYDGQLDAAGKVLTLTSEGPSFANDGTFTKYHDIIEVIDKDHYLLTSEFQNSDGSWSHFMTSKYSRVNAAS